MAVDRTSEHYKQTTKIIWDWFAVADTATGKLLYERLDAAGLLLTDERREATRKEGRTEAADAVWTRAKTLRAKDFPAGKVGIEYVNGFEDAAHVADPD